MGGWDDGSLDTLDKATLISGFGKVFLIPMVKSLKFAAKRPKLHNKYGLDDSNAIKEVKELMILKNQNSAISTRILK